MKVQAKLYIADAGWSGTVELFVCDGISSGRAWFTAYRRHNGCTARLKRKSLPVRTGAQGRAQAEDDLRRFALANGHTIITGADG